MKIYTKTGDDGSTALFGGGRVPKSDPVVEAYGTVDETNAAIGAARALGLLPSVDALLAKIQDDLFVLGSELACPPAKRAKLRGRRLGEEDVSRLERAIDAADSELPALKSFVLPCGAPASTALHLARAVCRRAERRAVAAGFTGHLLTYLNRLGDLLFVLARAANSSARIEDVLWKPDP